MSKTITNEKTYTNKEGKKVEEFDLNISLYEESASSTESKEIKEITTPEQAEALANRVLSGKTSNKTTTRGDEDAGKNEIKKSVKVEDNTNVNKNVEPVKPREEEVSTSVNNNKIVRR